MRLTTTKVTPETLRIARAVAKRTGRHLYAVLEQAVRLLSKVSDAAK